MRASQRVSLESDAVGDVNEAIQDGVGVSRVADQFVPFCHGKLAGDEGGSIAVPVLKYLKQMMAGIGVERLKSPVVEDEQVDAREAFQPYRNTSIAARHAQFVEQLAKPDVEDRQIVAAGLVPNGTGQPALARSGWAGDDEIVVTFDPVTLEKGFHKAPVSSWSRSSLGIAGSLRRDVGGLLFTHYACPHTEILTVPGWISHIFGHVCGQNGIEHRLTKPYHPSTNGQAERMVRTIKEATVKILPLQFGPGTAASCPRLADRIQLRQAAQGAPVQNALRSHRGTLEIKARDL